MSDEEAEQGERRPYRKRKRARAEERTRERITSAAVRLHGTVGPARTTMSSVAREAGVQRSTVYRHFPTETELFQACSGHWVASNPPPDPGAWREIADPDERLQTALSELYGWYERAEPMLANTLRDAPLVPAMAGPMEAFGAALAEMRSALLSGRSERGGPRSRVSAAIALALSFPAWQSLARESGLERSEAVALMRCAVRGAAQAPGARSPGSPARP